MKNVITILYIIIVVSLISYIFHPETAVIGICLLIALIKCFCQVVFSFDLTNKNQFMWQKITTLLVLTIFACVGLWIIKDENWNIFRTHSAANLQTIGNLKAVIWTTFFSIVGVDIHFIYSYLFEKNKKTLLS